MVARLAAIGDGKGFIVDLGLVGQMPAVRAEDRRALDDGLMVRLPLGPETETRRDAGDRLRGVSHARTIRAEENLSNSVVARALDAVDDRALLASHARDIGDAPSIRAERR